MNLEPAPRLPKLPFFVGDAVLLLTAGLLAALSPHPLGADTVLIIAVLVAIGAGLFVAPFISSYTADTAEAAEQERLRLNEQAARLHATAESLARTAAHIKAVEEAAHKSAREAETLPYRMQEKLAEFNETLAAKEDSDRENLETELEALRAAHADQLKAVAEKIGKAAADWTALDVATRKQLAAAEASLAKLQAGSAEAAAKLETQIATALKELDARLAELKQAAASIPATVTVTAAATPAPTAPAPVPLVTPPEPAPAPEPLALAPAPEEFPTEILPPEAPASTEPATAVSPPPEPTAEPASLASAEAPKPKKPRAPRKPRSEDTPAAPADPASEPLLAPEPTPAPVAPPPEPASEPTEEPAPEPAPVLTLSSDDSDAPSAGPVESSTSSDGATRLLATAYIGIGNKLFIRGDGPGLSWDHGVPMQFVSIGKWGWSTQDAAGPVRCKLYKNDEVLALTGEIVLEAGRHTEVTALF